MKNEGHQSREQLNLFTDKLIDTVINTPDAEILKEVEEDYGDPSYEANRVRELIEKSWIKAGKNRFPIRSKQGKLGI